MEYMFKIDVISFLFHDKKKLFFSNIFFKSDTEKVLNTYRLTEVGERNEKGHCTVRMHLTIRFYDKSTHV